MEIVRYVKIDVSKFTHVGNKKKLLTAKELQYPLPFQDKKLLSFLKIVIFSKGK